MVIGVITWELEIFGCQSLKEKRTVIRSLKDRLRTRLHVSVAETGHQDLWQRGELSACWVASDRRQAESVMEQVDRLVDAEGRARVIQSHRAWL